MNAAEFKERVIALVTTTPLCKMSQQIERLSMELFPEEFLKLDAPEKFPCQQCKGKGFIVEQQIMLDV
jgi:hypothetical protein